MAHAAPQTELPEAFLSRPEPDPEPVGNGITRMLRALRAHLGMDVAFASEIRDGKVIIRHADTIPDGALGVGDEFVAEDGYCQRIVDGRLPYLMPDTSTVPEAAALACTRELPVGAHISVPLILRDGSVYGTFCCFNAAADPSLNQRDLDTLRAFADLAAAEIDDNLRADRERKAARERIESVIARGPLGIVYQPIHCLNSGRVVGLEALARFADSALRRPSEWFEEAAEAGIGVDLEMAAVRGALAGSPYLPEDVYLAVNVSPATVLSGQLEAVISGVADGRVVIELTEHEAVSDYVALKQALEPLRGRARLAIDDVGAGYAGMRHILDLEPDIVKLDMSLVRDIDKDPARRALALALVAFTSGMHSEIVAEGVETAGELAVLRALGIPKAQGYFLSRPMPLVVVQKFILGDRLAAAD